MSDGQLAEAEQLAMKLPVTHLAASAAPSPKLSAHRLTSLFLSSDVLNTSSAATDTSVTLCQALPALPIMLALCDLLLSLANYKK